MQTTAQDVSTIVTTVAQVSGDLTNMNETITKALQDMNINCAHPVSLFLVMDFLRLSYLLWHLADETSRHHAIRCQTFQ